MCGIVGLQYLDGRRAEYGQIECMAKTLQHRGPDESGYFVSSHTGLGMRRLKVIDLETGRQPQSNETDSIYIVFNGEIYNFQNLRQELQAKGHHFKTHSDTEIIIHGFEEEGINFFKKLNGMFSFALYEKRANRLIVARDRIGIKPLYYYYDDRCFIFASEMKPFFEIPEIAKQIDAKALDQYLTLEYCLTPRTIIKGIKKLLPAHVIILQTGKIHIQPYWELKTQNYSSSDNLEELLREKISLAVKKRMISDVPFGAFLSGGIDSSIIVALMAQYSSRPIKTFSMGFEDQTYNELKYARLIAERFQTDHYEEILKPDLGGMLEQFINYLDEPMADVSIFPTYLISKLARKEVTVVLSGDGGDELFGGYETYLAHLIDRYYYHKLPKFLKYKILPQLFNLIPPTSKKKGLINRGKRFLEGASFDSKLMHYRWMIYLNNEQRNIIYKREFKKLLNKDEVIKEIIYRLNTCRQFDSINMMMRGDLSIYLLEDILTKVDRMSMAVSLEARVPFLDHEIVELAFSIPGSMKINGFRTKQILRSCFSNMLPHQILNRGKEGFSIPLKNCMRCEMKEQMMEILSKDNIAKIGYLSPNGVTLLMKEHISGKANHQHRLWALIVLVLWHKKYMERS